MTNEVADSNNNDEGFSLRQSRQWRKLQAIATTTVEVVDNSSNSDGSSRGHLSLVEEPVVLSLDDGRNCTRSDSERKLWPLLGRRTCPLATEEG
ncbi:hypothetical protein BHE74_00002428 [Ensete ventricosum]|nr:hypothetical protein GW17_00023420 [Ensete ventricosum]RWW88681.1 hypothetical protein BHE74_00002428 [Ensete ventricosum]RZR98159.1 hypothetical protein BHM03_00027474 [Ensete ventricosum]